MTTRARFILLAVGAMLAAAALALATIGSPGVDAARKPRLEVTGLCSSGRPAPTWTIRSGREVERRLAGIQPGPVPGWAQFGWRGFQVVNTDPKLAVFPLVRVFQGAIELGSGSYFNDTNGLERFLARSIPKGYDRDRDGVPDACQVLPEQD